MVGDQVYIVAIAWQVRALTNSAEALSIVLLFYSLSQLIFLLLGGVIVDRFSRRAIMLTSDIGRGILVLIVAWLAQQNSLEIWHLAVLSAFNGAVAAFFVPARFAVQSQLVDKDHLGSANSLMGLAFQVSVIGGPLLGALLTETISVKGAFLFDAVTFMISALCIILIVLPANDNEATAGAGSTKPRAGLLQQAREGFYYIRKSVWLWLTITIFAFIGLVLMGPMQVLVALLVQQKFSADVTIFGLLLSMRAVAAVIGTITIGQFKHLHHRGLIAYLSVIASALGVLLLGVGGSSSLLIVCILGMFGLGAGFACFDIIWNTVIQETVPAEYLGRVFSLDMLGSFCMMPIGLAVAGLLADAWGAAAVLIISGLSSALVAASGLLVHEIRELP